MEDFLQKISAELLEQNIRLQEFAKKFEMLSTIFADYTLGDKDSRDLKKAQKIVEVKPPKKERDENEKRLYISL